MIEDLQAPGSAAADLDAVRGQRRSLRRALSALEDALAAPMAGHERDWVARLLRTLDHLSDVFEHHVEVTEGPGGLYEDVLDMAPRLDNIIRRFRIDHEAIRAGIQADQVRLRAATAGEPVELEPVRRRLTRLLGRLVRHRQQGAELIYEAYAVDIGGES
jgi:Hemerythrin HHE cation binding domain